MQVENLRKWHAILIDHLIWDTGKMWGRKFWTEKEREIVRAIREKR